MQLAELPLASHSTTNDGVDLSIGAGVLVLGGLEGLEDGLEARLGLGKVGTVV
jgi:hypothetical protein